MGDELHLSRPANFFLAIWFSLRVRIGGGGQQKIPGLFPTSSARNSPEMASKTRFLQVPGYPRCLLSIRGLCGGSVAGLFSNRPRSRRAENDLGPVGAKFVDVPAKKKSDSEPPDNPPPEITIPVTAQPRPGPETKVPEPETKSGPETTKGPRFRLRNCRHVSSSR